MNFKAIIKACSLKNFKRIVNDYVLNSNESNSKIVYSIMLGSFMAVAPFWGLQAFVSLLFAYILKLNKVLSVTFTTFNIPFIPVILFSSYWVGAEILRQPIIFSLADMDRSMIQAILLPYLLGSVIVAAALSAFMGLVFALVLRYARKNH